MRRLFAGFLIVAALIVLNPLLSWAATPEGALSQKMGKAREALTKAMAEVGLPKSVVAMRANKKADTCEGRVLGFDWEKAYADTGVKAEEMAPPDGQGNPMFWVARARMSRELARLPKEKLLGYVAALKQFSGKANLADKVAGGDPYAQVWNQ